jgi:hypothetical protein
MTLENGCKIGSLNVTNDGIGFTKGTASDYTTFILDENGILFNDSGDEATFNVNEEGLSYEDSEGSVLIGYGGCGLINAITSSANLPLNCTNEEVALRVATAEDKYAIENVKGMFAGLRPATRTI